MLLNIKNSLSETSKASIAYIIANCMSKGINLVTIPFFTRVLSLNEMGVTTVFSSWFAILYPIATMSLSAGSVNSAMVEFKENRNQYLSSVLFLSSISSIVLSMILYIVSSVFSVIMLPKVLLPLIFALFLLQPAMDLWLIKSRYENKYLSVLCISVVTSIGAGLLSVFCVYFFKKYEKINLGIVRLYAQYGFLLICCLCLYIGIFINNHCLYNKKIWTFAFRLSCPLIIHSLAKNILDISDRLMIAHFCGESYAGIYGTIYTISNIPLIFWTAINAALIPYMFEEINQNNTAAMSKRIITVLQLFALIVLFVITVSPEILKLLTSKEYHNTTVFSVLLLGIFFTALYNIYGNLLLYKKKTIYIMFGTLIALVINILLNFICIPKFGYQAAAYTTLISLIVLCLSQGIFCFICYKKNVLSVFSFLMSSLIFISLGFFEMKDSFFLRIALFIIILIMSYVKITRK